MIIKKLEDKLEKFENVVISSKGNIGITNNNVNNTVTIHQYLDLTKDNVRGVIEAHLTKEVVGQGAVGLANMVCDKLLKGDDGVIKYKCVDPSRQIFEYKNEDGDTVKDMKANKLTTALIQSGNLDEQARKSGNKLWMKEDGEVDFERFNVFQPKVNEIMNLGNDNTKFRSALTSRLV